MQPVEIGFVVMIPAPTGRTIASHDAIHPPHPGRKVNFASIPRVPLGRFQRKALHPWLQSFAPSGAN